MRERHGVQHLTMRQDLDHTGTQHHLTLSLATYLAMRKEMVAAAVADPDTTIVPGTMPKMTPAVMVRGMAGSARTCSRAQGDVRPRAMPDELGV